MISKKTVSILDSKVRINNSIMMFYDILYQKNKLKIGKRNRDVDDIIDVIFDVFQNIYIGESNSEKQG